MSRTPRLVLFRFDRHAKRRNCLEHVAERDGKLRNCARREKYETGSDGITLTATFFPARAEPGALNSRLADPSTPPGALPRSAFFPGQQSLLALGQRDVDRRSRRSARRAPRWTSADGDDSARHAVIDQHHHFTAKPQPGFRILKRGVDSWNAWRRRAGMEPELSAAEAPGSGLAAQTCAASGSMAPTCARRRRSRPPASVGVRRLQRPGAHAPAR